MTDDGLVVLASEVVLDIDPATVVRKGRLQPGRVFLADTVACCLVEDEEVKAALAAEHPYEDWLHAGHPPRRPARPPQPGGSGGRAVPPDGGAPGGRLPGESTEDIITLQRMHGYTEEELRVILAPMARTGAEPIGSMGTDTPVAVLSDRPRLVFDYFSQLFAQVTNPPLDAIREELVTSLGTITGLEQNLLEPIPASCSRRQIVLPYPVISDNELAKIVHINDEGNLPGFASHVVDGRYDPRGGGEGLRARLAVICARSRPPGLAPARSSSPTVPGIWGAPPPGEVRGAGEPFPRGVRGMGPPGRRSRGVWGDGPPGPALFPIPSLLLTGAVHHHLIKQKSRTRAGLIVEAGDVRECHHVALLVGYGAAAVNPYLAIELVRNLVLVGVILRPEADREESRGQPAKALGKGLLKIMSKMGVSTVASYTGAQIFEAIGLGPEVIEGPRAPPRGCPASASASSPRRSGGGPVTRPAARAWRSGGSRAAVSTSGGATASRTWSPGSGLQAAARHPQPPVRDLQGVHHADRRPVPAADDAARVVRIRGVDQARDAGEAEDAPRPVRVDDVEPVASIVAVRHRSHVLRLDLGRGPPDPRDRDEPAGRQVEHGRRGRGPGPVHSRRQRRPAPFGGQAGRQRFGVTSEYLVNADDLQIKMAQGAKPGEGGQLPGHKVYPWIAKTRYSTPGVGLISPPPHHDIYSIEDLAQLIHDLKNANPAARVHVKLVSEVGVGMVAGVSKAHADVVLISGHDGGTGAAPLYLAQARGRAVGARAGRNPADAAAQQAAGPDRGAGRRPAQDRPGRDHRRTARRGGVRLRQRAAGRVGLRDDAGLPPGHLPGRRGHPEPGAAGPVHRPAEFVVNFFEFIAEEVRSIWPGSGSAACREIIGRVDLLDTVLAVEHWKAAGLDLSPILYAPALPEGAALSCVTSQDHGLDKALDNMLIQLAEGALEEGRPVRLDLPIRNVNRTVGTMLGYEVTRRWAAKGCPTTPSTSRSAARPASRSVPSCRAASRCGSMATPTTTWARACPAGGSLSGPPAQAAFTAEEQVIAGNVIGYGATGGEIFLRGIVGERFCVRNSGALAVAEGTGDHGCEYMTGGRVVILGPVGRNFAAGMSGGIAYVLDLPEIRVNMEMVDLDQVAEDDAKFVREAVERHHAETGSAVAARLLADWDPGRFTKVMPKECCPPRHRPNVMGRQRGRHGRGARLGGDPMADPKGFPVHAPRDPGPAPGRPAAAGLARGV